MIPVEYTAGGTALCTHHQSEGTPDKHAYKVAYVERRCYHKQCRFADDTAEIKHTYNGDESRPHKHYHIGGCGGGGDVFFESLTVYLFSDRLKAVGKELLRAQSHLVLYGDDLQYHIYHPYHPQYMEDGELLKEVHSV